MAESNVTKRALAASLKALMNEMSFSKITVSDICNRCGMNRKSFYYHFKDKYDLVNWVYDTEFIAVVEQKSDMSAWQFFVEMCRYLDSERRFYCHALKITGQNSFSEHFVELMQPVITERLREIFGANVSKYYAQFFSDAFTVAIKRWLTEMPELDAEAFIELVQSIIMGTCGEVR